MPPHGDAAPGAAQLLPADGASTASVAAALPGAPAPSPGAAPAAWPVGGPLGGPRPAPAAQAPDAPPGAAAAEPPAGPWPPSAGAGDPVGFAAAAAPADAQAAWDANGAASAVDGGAGGPLVWARLAPPGNASTGAAGKAPALWAAAFVGCGAPCDAKAERAVLCRDARGLPAPPSACGDAGAGAFNLPLVGQNAQAHVIVAALVEALAKVGPPKCGGCAAPVALLGGPSTKPWQKPWL